MANGSDAISGPVTFLIIRQMGVKYRFLYKLKLDKMELLYEP